MDWLVVAVVNLVGEDMNVYQKVLTADPWVLAQTNQWDSVGQAARMGFVLGTDVGQTGTMQIYSAAGSYYPATALV